MKIFFDFAYFVNIILSAKGFILHLQLMYDLLLVRMMKNSGERGDGRGIKGHAPDVVEWSQRDEILPRHEFEAVAD